MTLILKLILKTHQKIMNGTHILNNYIVITILVKNKKKLSKNLLYELDTEITIEEIIKTAKGGFIIYLEGGLW